MVNTLKIVQVNRSEALGGAAKIALSLHQGMQKMGHTSWMFVDEKESTDRSVIQIPDQDKFFSAPFFEMAATKLARIKTQILGKTASDYLRKFIDPRRLIFDQLGLEDFYYPASRKLFNLLPSLPDIVHLHNLHDNYFDLNFLPELSLKAPTIITLHDAWLLSGHCAHSLDCEKWKTGCGQCPYLEIYPAVKRDRTHYNWRHKKGIFSRSRLYIATPSNWLMQKIDQSILKPAMLDRRVIHNGVDLSIFNPIDRKGARGRLGIPEDVGTLLFVAQKGSQNAYKDFETISKTIEIIKSCESDKEILLLIVGGAEASEIEEKYANNIRTRHIPYQTDLRVVADYYRAADVYLQASRADTFPTVILEALACGTPVIATGVGGIPEQIIDGKTGYLVKPGDSAAMAELTIKILANKETGFNMGEQAVEDARKRFRIEQMISGYLDWYFEIIEKRSSKASVDILKSGAEKPAEHVNST